MKLHQLVNTLLAPANIRITKRSTLDYLQHEVQFLREQQRAQTDCACSVDSLFQELLRNQIAQKWSQVDFMDGRDAYSRANLRFCALCGHEAEDARFEKRRTHCAFGGGDLLRHICPACGVIFGPDKMFRLTEAELSQEYEWHYKAYQEGDSTEQEIRAFFSLNPSKDGIYLNYGAGAWSRSAQKLRADGWNVVAFEPHSSATSTTDSFITSRDQLRKIRFNGIFSNNVLEHFRHPASELARIKDLLKPNGRMAHATPCFAYLYEYTRFHLFFFPKDSRATLLCKAGLKEVDFIHDQEFMCSISEPTLQNP